MITVIKWDRRKVVSIVFASLAALQELCCTRHFFETKDKLITM